MFSLSFLAFISVSFLAAAIELPTVETSYGPVSGVYTATTVAAFFGIPYAQPPLGALRFKPPLSPEPWNETLNLGKSPGRDFGCVQASTWSDGSPESGTEDCLKLMIYSPALPGDSTNFSAAPVLLWIHGGSFVAGDAWDGGLYDGTALAKRHGAVVVAVQYRLGALGFLALEQLRQEDPAGSTGNYGVMDQRQAMRWVQDNIQSFGGDPNRVTIFGQSAGAMSVCFHLVSPGSKGLFSAAIMESGSCDMAWTFDGVEAKQQWWQSADDKSGCDPTSNGYVECLRKTNARVLASVHGNTWDRMLSRWGPTVDGSQVGLTFAPLDIISRGDASNVPVLLGTNSGDPFPHSFLSCLEVPGRCSEPLKSAFQFLTTDAGARMFLHLRLGSVLSENQWEQVLAEYPLEVYNGSGGLRFAAIIADAGFTRVASSGVQGVSVALGECGTLRAARELSRSNTRIWLYHFARLGNETMYHGSELPYVFENMPEHGSTALALVGHFWTNLAFFGDPNGGSSKTLPEMAGRPMDAPYWPRFSESGSELAWGVTAGGPGIAVQVPVQSPRCEFWQRLLASGGSPRRLRGITGPFGGESASRSLIV